MEHVIISTALLLGSAIYTVVLYTVPTQHPTFRAMLIGISYLSILVALTDLGFATILLLM